MFNFHYIIFKIFVICNTNHQNVHRCSENLIYFSQYLDYCISLIYTTGYEKKLKETEIFVTIYLLITHPNKVQKM